MIGFSVTGRPAWIAAMVLGVVLVIVGLAVKSLGSWPFVAGGAFFVFGLVMLIISLATKGASD